MVRRGPKVRQVVEDLLYDPQTSGGLLISVDYAQADRLLDALKAAGISAAAVIAEVVEGSEEKIYIE
jgi:selenide, water dikinase